MLLTADLFPPRASEDRPKTATTRLDTTDTPEREHNKSAREIPPIKKHAASETSLNGYKKKNCVLELKSRQTTHTHTHEPTHTDTITRDMRLYLFVFVHEVVDTACHPGTPTAILFFDPAHRQNTLSFFATTGWIILHGNDLV